MNFNSEILRIVYRTDPRSIEYRYPFKIFTEKGLRVSLVDPGDREQAPMILGVDYEVTGVGEADGGLVRLTLAGLHKAEKGLKLVVKKGVAHQAHGDQAAIEALNAHKVEETAHAALFEKQEEALNAHNGEETAHAALFEKQAVLFDAKIRRRLTGNLTLLVSRDGNDANDGSEEYPFASLYGAYKWWKKNIDSNGYKTTINIAPGIYEQGSGYIQTNSFDEFRIQGLDSNSPPEIPSLLFQNSPNVSIGDLIIGFPSLSTTISSLEHSTCWITAPLKLRGNSDLGFLRAESFSRLYVFGAEVTFENTTGLAVHSRFNGDVDYSHAAGSVVNGNHTGKRYECNYGPSVIHVYGKGPNAFPGTIDGTVNTAIGCYYY